MASYTLTYSPNSGSVSPTSASKTYPTIATDLPTPTRQYYDFKGWCYHFNGSSQYVSLGNSTTYRKTSGSWRVTLWTYAADYAQHATIIGCAEDGGWCLINETKSDSSAGSWSFQVKDGSTWRKVNYAASNISAGYHTWCLSFDATNKQIKMFLDGSQVGSTVSLTNTAVTYNSTWTKIYVGAEMTYSGSDYAVYPGYYFNGYVGNIRVQTSAGYAAPNLNAMCWPEQNATVYAYWEKHTYPVTVNLNGGTGGPGSSFTATAGSTKSLTAPTRTGYDFIGWACSSTGGTIQQDYANGSGFFTTVPDKYIWAGSGTNNSTIALANMVSASGFPTSEKMITITEPGTSTKSIGWERLTSIDDSSTIYTYFVAKAPMGTYFLFHNNTSTFGTGYTYEYLTPMAGTGEWQTYCIKFVSGTSAGSIGRCTLAGDETNVATGTNPGNISFNVAYVGISKATSLNSSRTYAPSETATADTITAIWIEKKYSITYNANGGNALTTDQVYTHSSANKDIGALNPTSAQWNRSPYVLGTQSVGNNPIATVNRSNNWFRVSHPSKDSVTTTTVATYTTSFNAASAVSSLTNTKTTVKTTAYDFNSWTITGMDSGVTHYYYGAASGETTNSSKGFTSTSITLNATSATAGVGVPIYYHSLRSTPGTVTFKAGWVTTTTTVTTTTSINLPNVPAKANTTATITRTVKYNANGGNSTPSDQSVSPTATVTWTDDDKWWTTSTGGTGYAQATAYTPTSSATLYAHYTASTGTYSSPTIALPAAIAFPDSMSYIDLEAEVSFVAASAVPTETVVVDQTVVQPKTFDKWRLGSASGTSYAAGAKYTPTTGTTTFYATSKNNGAATTTNVFGSLILPTVPTKSSTTSTITRTVSYNANGGNSTPSSQSVSPTATVLWAADTKWYTSDTYVTAAGTQGTTYTPSAFGTTLYAKYTGSTGTYSSPSITLPSAISKANDTATKYVVYNKNTGTTVSSASTSFIATTAYTFDKWRLGSTTGTSYTAGAKYTPTVSSTTFYATFTGSTTAASITTATATKANTSTTATITYNVNTGTTVSPSSASYGVTISWTGNGWYTAATGGTKRANMGASYTPPIAGETVYAQWSESGRTAPSITLPTATKNNTTANKTITYNANGGSVSPTSATYVVTTSYTNTQWNIGSASGTKLGNAGTQVTAPTSNTTVYAVWSSSDSSAAVTLPTPTRTGYTVTGWYSASSGGTKKGNAGASYTPSTTGETVYAQWSGYVVSVASASTTMGTASGGGTYAGSSLTITASPKTGYHFVKWTGGDVNNNTNASVSFTPTSSFTATANFAANTYTVVYNANGGSGTMANSSFTYNGTGNLTSNAFTAPSGYTFGGWASSVSNATAGTVYRADGAAHGNMTSTNGGTVTIYAIWQRTIAFQSRSGGTITNANRTQYYNSSTSSGAALTAPDTAARTPSGWTFTGWRDDTTADAYEVAPGGSTTPTTVTQYYAIYTATITFYHGYNKSKSNTATGYYNANSSTGQSVIAPAIQSITYWTAYGWKPDTTTTTTNAKTVTTAAAVTGMGEVRTYYALYSQSASLTYAGNGNTGGSTSASTSNTRYLNSGTTTLSSTTLSWTLAQNGFTKTGYSFNGWDVGAAGATYSPTIAYNANPAKTATAQWTVNSYTFTLNKNGGTGGSNSVTITYGTTAANYPSITLPTRAGFVFQGYYTATSGGTQYYTAEGAGAIDFTLTSDGTWYAHWIRQGATRNMYVYNGSAWKVATPYVFNGTTWKRATAYIYNGTAWKQASTFPD